MRTNFPDAMPLATVLDLPMFAPENISAIGKVGLALADHPAIQAELKQSNTKMLIPLPLSQYQLMGTRRVVKLDDFSPVDRARLLARAIKVWQGWVEERDRQGLKGKEVFEFAQARIREFSR